MSNALLVGINVWRAWESVLIRPEAETRALVVYVGFARCRRRAESQRFLGAR